jgi:hypothetical protein
MAFCGTRTTRGWKTISNDPWGDCWTGSQDAYFGRHSWKVWRQLITIEYYMYNLFIIHTLFQQGFTKTGCVQNQSRISPVVRHHIAEGQ